MSVCSQKESLQRLRTYKNSPAPILSAYFTIDVSASHDDLVNEFSALIERELSFKERASVERNITYISGFLQNYTHKNGEKSFAFFSGGDSLFEVLHLPYKIANTVFLSHSPVLQPILEQESIYRHYLVILMDREKALFMILSQGMVEKSGYVFDPSVPQNVHADSDEASNNQREDKINRHIQDHIHRHFQLFVTELENFLENEQISGVLIGGHKNLFQKFEHHLPKSLQDKIVGEFVTELNINFNQLVEKSKKLIQEIDKKFNNEESPYMHLH